MLKRVVVFCIVLLALLPVAGCALFFQPPESVTRENALKKIRWFGKPEFQDDLNKESLLTAIDKNLIYLNRLPDNRAVYFGTKKYTVRDLKESSLHLADIIKETGSMPELDRRIKQDFDIYSASGMDRKRSVLFTGYYEPVFPGARQKDEIFRFPLYRRPEDLLVVDLGMFAESLKGKKITARLDGKGISPYFTRKMIAVDDALSGRGLELLWLSSPIDVFFLHIQGSGIIREPGGTETSVNYSAANGRRYRSVGRLLIDQGKVPKEKMSMQAIRTYLLQHPEEVDQVLNHNESYVFFREVKEGPVGSTNVLLTSGRSIAADNTVFPKGGVAFIETEIPMSDENGVVKWKKISRFVIDQDRGGAIKGAGRADIFFGTGEKAGQVAGKMNRKGRLFYLVKKRS